MSANNPIPVRLRAEFVGVMGAHDDDDMADGAWFAILEDAAQTFIDAHRLKWADRTAATHQYLRLAHKVEEEGKS